MTSLDWLVPVLIVVVAVLALLDLTDTKESDR